MSRGYGKIQRRLLEILDEAANDEDQSAVLLTPMLVARVFSDALRQGNTVLVSRAQVETVRRALRQLQREGAILDFGRLYRKKSWVSRAIGTEMLESLETFARHGGKPLRP
jgi:hypothetical protein